MSDITGGCSKPFSDTQEAALSAALADTFTFYFIFFNLEKVREMYLIYYFDTLIFIR